MSVSFMDNPFKMTDRFQAITLVETKPISQGKYLEIHIPHLMGLIKNTGKETINHTGLFCNDKACEVKVQHKVIIKKNTIPAKLKPNCDWLGKLNSKGNIPKNSDFVVEFTLGDIIYPTITTS